MKYKVEDFMLIAVRSSADVPNSFDDAFYLVTPNAFYQFTCSTNPGTYWLLNYLNGGAALLKPGQYLYKLGLHRGQYKALVQASKVTVYRDSDKDLKAEETAKTETGYFGINIHRASDKWTSKLVDKWSAGCIVLNNPKDFDILIRECELSHKSIFILTLLREF